MQLDLFKEPVVINEDPERRVCKKCGEEKSLDDFNAIYYRKNGEATKGYRCADCQKQHSRTVSTLKKIHPKPRDNVCECCGDVAEKMCLDHSHKTGAFRGWVCEGCNHSMGKSGDDPEKLIKQAEYLRERSSK